MPSPTRPMPYVGMPVRVVHLGVSVAAEVEEVCDDGRTLVAGGHRYTLRRMTGHFVRDDEPYYGTRLSLRAQ